MPARKNKSRSYSRVKKRNRTVLPYFILIAILSLVFIIFFKSSLFWDGKSKLSMVVKRDDGFVQVTTFDPETSEIFNIMIPGDTEVELARKLGKTRIKNAWQIGINAKHEGLVLAETVTRNFRFPVYIWADKEGVGFSDTNLTSILSATFKPYKTNLKIGDRLRLALFAISVKNVERENIDLTDTAYLKETTLIDGGVGYKITGNFPQNLLVVFVDSNLTKDSTAVIMDESGDSQIASFVTEVLEVEGAKVVQILKYDVRDYDCEVGGLNKKLIEKVAKVFSCKKNYDNIDGNSDLYLKLGKGFADRF
jgi:hypothetical protein